MKMPKVSIVLPTYNGEKYIRESIDSVINQTFTDWELIIVNDCSTDNTQNIIDSYVEMDGRISTIKNDINQKLPESLNIGFRKALGEYLTWTSDDNCYLQNAIESMVHYLDENENYQMVCARMDFVDKNGNFLYKHVEYSDEVMFYNDCVGACFMYRKLVPQEIGEYDIHRFCIEDYEYWMRVLKHFGTIGFINSTLYRYRNHEESLTRTKKELIHRQLLKYRISELNWILDNLQERPELITKMYCEFIGNGHEMEFLVEACKYVPELSMLLDKMDYDQYIIWGAGEYGKKALDALRGRIYCFADKNPNIAGGMIDGIKIISYEEMMELPQKVICIAISDEHVYYLLKDLYQRGIKHCRIVQEFI